MTCCGGVTQTVFCLLNFKLTRHSYTRYLYDPTFFYGIDE